MNRNTQLEDRRKQIIEAGLAILRTEGLAGLTQPRIAARTGLRQSHLTYYYPTRTDLVVAVARAAIDIQASAAKYMSENISTAADAAKVIAKATVRHENTRVLTSLNQAAAQEPDVRQLFNGLTSAVLGDITEVLAKLDLEQNSTNADIIHALFVGLSVINLATEHVDGEARSHAALETVFKLLAQTDTVSKRSNVKKPSRK